VTVVITGGATGIGFETARCLGRDGQTVVLASRKRNRLEDACGRLHGCFHCSRALARRLTPGLAHSAAAKAGMVAFTRSVAPEWGPHGIRVNALAPGFVPTEQAVAGILDTAEAQDRMRDMIPLGRFGEVTEIADVVAFLLSDAASYITGSVLAVDGGRSLGQAMHSVAAEEV